jgi:hypothetical protein
MDLRKIITYLEQIALYNRRRKEIGLIRPGAINFI